MGSRPIVNDYRRDQEASQSVAPVAPIVHYVGSQIFANELHEPVALTVIKYVVERLRCVGDLAQVRGLHGVGVGLEAIDRTDDHSLRKASNTHTATAATARRMIKLVLMSHLTLKIQVIGVGHPPS
jgi:hypothetical protein